MKLASTLWFWIGLPVVIALHAHDSDVRQHVMALDDYPTFIPFDQFLNQVQLATYGEYEDDEVESEAEFYKMKQHVLYMYEGIRRPAAISSFVQGEQYVDCVPIYEQPTYYHLKLPSIAEPPEVSTPPPTSGGDTPGNTSDADSPLKLGLKDPFGNPISCHEGSIPMTRLTLHSLTIFRTLNDFFSKGRRVAPDNFDSSDPLHPRDLPGWDVHHHDYGTQTIDNFGGNSWLNLWNPLANFSLSQQWYVGGSGCNTQTVEGGWQVADWWGTDGQAVLFIYYTNHNYNRSGCFTATQFGCYNLDCPAFCQKNHNWHLGGIWDHYSSMDKEQWGFEMQWKLYKSNWWLFLKGPGAYEPVGYYPTSIYNGGQLATNATRAEFGGEVSRRKDGSDWPQMGSGQFPAKGFGEAAFQKTVFWIARDENDGFGEWTRLKAVRRASLSCYDINMTNFPDGGDWGTHFYFGGPGGGLC